MDVDEAIHAGVVSDSDDELEEEEHLPRPEGDTHTSALADNIRRKGKNAYYYAHAKKLGKSFSIFS